MRGYNARSVSIQFLFTFFIAIVAAKGQPYAYVADPAGNRVSILDTATNTVAGGIAVDGTPTGLASTPDGEYVYVSAKNKNSVVVISTTSRQIVQTIPVGSSPVEVALAPHAATVYVVNHGSNSISVIDPTSQGVTATIPLSAEPSGIAIIPDGSRIFITSSSSGQISVIDTGSNTVTATWPDISGISGIAVSPDGNLVYVANPSQNSVSVRDASTGTIVGTINGFNAPNSVAVAPNGKQVYVTNGAGGSVSVIDASSRQIVTTIAVGASPTSMSLAPDGLTAYVSSGQDGSIALISTATNTISATIPNAGTSAPSLVAGGSAKAGSVLPVLPQATVNTTYPTVTGKSIAVHAGGDFASALKSANCGDEVVLDAGATFTGVFYVPGKKCGSKQILIRSSKIGSLPSGRRVSPASTSYMARLMTPSISSVLNFDAGASGYYFAGLEFTVQTGLQGLWNLVTLSMNVTSVSDLPSNIVFDRVYAHGNDQFCVRGFLADAAGFALINSYVSGFTHTGYDTQAVMAFNSPGPYVISNNYLEATGENIMLGGGNSCTSTSCTPRIPGAIPSDATITRNHFTKLYGAWNGKPQPGPTYDIKNSFEVKNGQRILLDSNVFSYDWGQGQNGEFVLLTPRAGCLSPPSASNCADPQATASDITITNNVFEHGGQVFNGAGVDNYAVPYVKTASQRVLIQNNLANDINGASYVGNGYFGSVQETTNWTINHNTVINTPKYPQAFYLGPTIPASNTPGPAHDAGLTYTNNIAFGAIAADASFSLTVLQNLPSSATVSYDLWVGDTWPASCPGCTPLGPPYPSYLHFFQAVSNLRPLSGQQACNWSAAPLAACWPLDFVLVGFTNFLTGNYQLLPTSPYHNMASDGTDLGANIPVVLADTAGVVQ